MKTIVDKPLRIGDRIRVISEFMGLPMANQKGTIKEIIYGIDIAVEFDNPFLNGHSLHGKCKDGYGRYGKTYEVKKLYTRTYHDLFGSIV